MIDASIKHLSFSEMKTLGYAMKILSEILGTRVNATNGICQLLVHHFNDVTVAIFFY